MCISVLGHYGSDTYHFGSLSVEYKEPFGVEFSVIFPSKLKIPKLKCIESDAITKVLICTWNEKTVIVLL